jgi:tetratricopeptide (TPR) repeat protein
MPLQIQIRNQQGICQVVWTSAPEELLAETALADLPAIDDLRKRPYQLGEALFAALGGMRMREQLEQCDDGLLLLECDEESQAVAWEYASSNGQFLACEFAMLRLVPRNPLPVRPEPPRLLVLCADPLVYPDGKREPAYRLDFKAELAALNGVFQKSKNALEGRQIPPTSDKLFAALQEGPALVHLSCHGGTIPFQTDSGPRQNAVLQLEDEMGQPKILLGDDLRRRAPRGSLHMVLLSACQSAPIARALAQQGVPVALGMQHNFPDPLSDNLAAEFYRCLINGYDVAEASRQARNNLAAHDSGAAGMLVVYSCQNAWQKLELPKGSARFEQGLVGDCRLPESLLAGNGELIGRNRALSELAALFNDKTTAVTIAGTGGIGKTSLARAFIERFGWNFGRVLGVSFAAAEVDLGQICRELLAQLDPNSSLLAAQEQQLKQQNELIHIHRQRLAHLEQQKASFGLHVPAHIELEIAQIEGELAQLNARDPKQETTERLLDRLLGEIQTNDLLLFDNYESVLNPKPGDEEQAAAIQRLLAKLIDRQARLLLTSRALPAGLAGEKLFPSREGLSGLQTQAAIELFGQHSTRSQGLPQEQHKMVMERIAHETDGHPLAIILLASAYDAYSSSAEQFLQGWSDALAKAEKQGLDKHHVTIAAAIERRILPLEPSKQARLLALSHYQMPFFGEAAALLWGLPCDENGNPTEAAMAEARTDLELFVQRSLLQVHATFEGGDLAASYQFQPVIYQELFRQVTSQTKPAGYYRYGFWLAKRAFNQIGRSVALSQLTYQSLALLEDSIEQLAGEDRLWHIRRIAWLYRQYGEIQKAQNHLELAIQQAEEGSKVQSALMYEQATICEAQGQYALALQLFEHTLVSYEELNDLKNRAVSLHAIAQIHQAQGQYPLALQLFEQSLAIKEELKDQRGKSASLHAIAQIHLNQGQYALALQLFEQSLAIKEELKDLQGKSVTLSVMANIYLQKKDWEKASRLLQEALAISQTIGDQANIAFNQVKLGQIALAQLNYAAARSQFHKGLAIFKQLGMPREIKQVEQLIKELEASQAQQPSLPTEIAAWIDDANAGVAQIEQLLALLNSSAQLTVRLIRAKAEEVALEFADQLVELRFALKNWPAAAELPPFNTFLGCLQALLRNQSTQLERLRSQLDPSLAQALQSVEQLISGEEIEAAQPSQIERLRTQVAQAMPAALQDSDQERKAGFIQQLEEWASQAAAGEAPGSPWLDLAKLLHACVALLRGQSYDQSSLLAEDHVLLQEWQRQAATSGSVTDDLASIQQALSAEIQAWIKPTNQEEQSFEKLLTLLEACSQLTVRLIREKAEQAALEFADQLVELRFALNNWPAAAELPPFNIFLGCLQALLRNQPEQLERLRSQLDTGLAQALQKVEQLINGEEVEIDQSRQVEEIRTSLAQNMPLALQDSDQERKARFIQQLEEWAQQAAAGESPGSPWLALANLLHACVALLHGQSYDQSSLLAEDRALLQEWQQQAAFSPSANVVAALQTGDQAALEQALQALPEAERQATLKWLQQKQQEALAAMDPEQRAALEAQMRDQQIEQHAANAEQATQAVLQNKDATKQAALAQRLLEVANHFAEGEAEGSPYAELALFLYALAALLRKEALPALASAYQARINNLIELIED